MINIKKKREAVAATFGISVDPEDVDFIDFMYARRHLATVPDGNASRLTSPSLTK